MQVNIFIFYQSLNHLIQNKPLVDKESEKEDIRHLEFSLTNNMKSLQSRATTLSDREIELVKLVICSSLYPQLAIGDEHNAYRKSNEIMFNTPGKNSNIDVCLSCNILTNKQLKAFCLYILAV